MNKKKTKTTYGVYNLIEWHALLRMGKATVKVPFTGGSITTQGVTPATFTTEDPVIQFAIEKSPEFLNGKIKVVRSVRLNEMIEIECNGPKIKGDVHMSTPVTHECAAAPAEDCRTCTNTPVVNEAEASDNTDTTALTQVEFSCNDDAKDYLEQTFGLVRSKLHNREDIINAGKAHGVEINFV